VTAFTALCSLAAAPAQAATLIPGVTASSTFTTTFGNLNNIVDGTGLPGGIPALTGTHDAASFPNTWAGTGTAGDINFNLGSLYDLDGFSFWNFNGSNTAGINGVIILTSINGVNYTLLPGSPTQFAIGVLDAPVSPQ
jgi:hypothetical protein